jgi:hypothetical protein
MAVAIVIVIVLAALLVIASGVWVAIGLTAPLVGPKSALPGDQDHTGREGEGPRGESDHGS